MRTLRSVGIAGLILGILFKTLHWPGAGVLALTSSLVVIGTLSVLLFRKPGPLSVELKRPSMLIGSVIIVVTGGIFKIMHWPGANVMLLLGLTTCAAWFALVNGRTTAAA